jgi:nitroreductase
MNLTDTIYSRRSAREFSAEPVDEPTLRRLIDLAIQAPSAVNEQPWSFDVIRDKKLMRRISNEAKAYTLGAPPAGIQSGHFEELLSNPDFNIFYDAPALIVISSRTRGPWADVNCALAAENLMLGACAAGLATCWIGFAQAWLGTPEGMATLGLPANYLPVAPIIVGHAKTSPPPVPRREPEIRWVTVGPL